MSSGGNSAFLFIAKENDMKTKIIHRLIAVSLFGGLFGFYSNIQANEAHSIEKSCIFFNKVVFHLTEDLTIFSNGNKIVLKAGDIRELIILGNYNTPTSVTQALIASLCSNHPNDCIHNVDNTKIDYVHFSADCDDNVIRKLTGGTNSESH
jgi:hypothetical protein